MGKNLFVLMDDTAKVKELDALVSCEKRNKIIVCYTGIRIKKCLRTKFEEFQGEVVFYPFAIKIRETSFLLRDRYIEFVANLGEKQIGKTDIKKYFRIPFRNISSWWFSLIAEKNPMKSNSFVTLCQLITAINIIEENRCNEILLMMKNRVLMFCLKSYAEKNNLKIHSRHFLPLAYEIFTAASMAKSALYNMFHMFKRSVVLRKKMRNSSSILKFLNHTAYVFFTYFPQIDRSVLSKQKFVNKYFGPIQSGFEKKYGKAITWILLQEQTSEFDEQKGINLAKKMNQYGYNMIFWEQFLSPVDFIKAVCFYLWLCIKFLVAKGGIKISSTFTYRKINVYPVFLKDWHRSFLGYVLLEGLFYLFAFEKCLRYIPKEAIVVYLAENQAWEKALCFAGKTYNLSTVGIHHTTVPVMMMNFFNDRREMCKDNYIDCVPRPEILGCAGEICRDMMLNTGWPDDRIFVSGGIRFGYLKTTLSSMNWRERKNSAVVALSIERNESI